MGALLFISFELIREREVAFDQEPLRGSSIPNSLEFGATVAEMGDLCFESGDRTLQCSAIVYSLLGRRPERRSRLFGLFGNRLGSLGCAKEVGNSESMMEVAFKVESIAGCNVTPAKHHRQTSGYGDLYP